MDATKADVIAMGSVLPAIDILVVALRFYSKRKRGSYGTDDWLMLASLIIACGCGSLLIIGSLTAGFGQKSPGTTSLSGYEESDPTLHATKRLAVCMNWMQLWTLGLSKLSVIFFYRSIFVRRPFRILSIVMIIIVTLWVLGGFFAVAFQCGTRITLLWASAKTTGVYCTAGKKVAFGFSIPDVIIDFMILCMPIYWTLKLHMSARKRLAVCGVFLFGAITVLASIIRLAFYMTIYPIVKHIPNQLGVQTTIVYWSMFEIGLSIIAACLPTFWPLLIGGYPSRLARTLRQLVTSLSNGSLGGSSRARATFDADAQPNLNPGSKEGFKVDTFTMHNRDRPSEEANDRMVVTKEIVRKESMQSLV